MSSSQAGPGALTIDALSDDLLVACFALLEDEPLKWCGPGALEVVSI